MAELSIDQNQENWLLNSGFLTAGTPLHAVASALRVGDTVNLRRGSQIYPTRIIAIQEANDYRDFMYKRC